MEDMILEFIKEHFGIALLYLCSRKHDYDFTY